MSHFKNVLIMVTTLASLTCETAFARNWHVSGFGSDDYDGGSPTTAFRTLQKAESMVQPGDVVLIGNGVYEGDPSRQGEGSALLLVRKSGQPNAWITWKARPGHKPELRPKQWSGIEIHGSYIVIEGLTLIGSNDAVHLKAALEAATNPVKQARYNTNGIFIDGRKLGPKVKPHHIVIRKNTVAKMGGGGITAIEADHVTIEDNKVFENAWYMEYAGSGITLLNNWAFDEAPGYHVVIRRNMVWNNKSLVPWNRTGKLSDGNGILLDVTDQTVTGGATNPNGDAVVSGPQVAISGPKRPVWKGRSLIANNLSAFNGGSGIHTFRTSHVDVINNTTYWNGSVSGYEEMFPNRSTDIVFLNNIIVPRPGGRVTSDNRNVAIRWDYNLYPTEQTVRKGPNDIVADPRFAKPHPDLLIADFKLAAKSPAKHSGTNELAQATDLRGVRRSTRRRDRGAYEQ